MCDVFSRLALARFCRPADLTRDTQGSSFSIDRCAASCTSLVLSPTLRVVVSSRVFPRVTTTLAIGLNARYAAKMYPHLPRIHLRCVPQPFVAILDVEPRRLSQRTELVPFFCLLRSCCPLVPPLRTLPPCTGSTWGDCPIGQLSSRRSVSVWWPQALCAHARNPFP